MCARVHPGAHTPREGTAFSPPPPTPPSVTLSLPVGSRLLVLGDNGSGKSTLLRILAGRHLVRDRTDGSSAPTVTVLGRDAFHDSSLNAERAYLSCDWGKKSVAFTGQTLLSADVAVRELMKEVQAKYIDRRDELANLLGVDLDWRMCALSDGQRRRVQIMLQLCTPSRLVLLDEITTDLDTLTRQDFLAHMKASSKAGVTTAYATHIFDGLDNWATHVAYLEGRRLLRWGRVEDFPELQSALAAGSAAPLLRTVEGWLREGRARKVAAGLSTLEKADGAVDELRGERGNGYLAGRGLRMTMGMDYN